MNSLCLKRAPTFSHNLTLELGFVDITIYMDDGTQITRPVFNGYLTPYITEYFELIKTCQYDMEKTHNEWNTWWLTGKLLKLDKDVRDLI